MSIKGLGTDIVEIARVAEAVTASDRLAKRVLTENEMKRYQEQKDKARYLAKRWAAKEAAAKALGTGIGRGISFQHFETSNNELGAPKLTLSAAAALLAQEKSISNIHISISDEVNYAVATVIYD